MMTDLQLQPLTGPGEYTQRNGLKAEIVGQDKDGMWHGWVSLTRKEREVSAWHPDGRDYEECETFDIVQPKPEIEIPNGLRYDMLDAYGENAHDLGAGLEAVARLAIAWDRANRPKREPTEEEMKECWAAYYRNLNTTIDITVDIEAAIRRAFELAQEPK